MSLCAPTGFEWAGARPRLAFRDPGSGAQSSGCSHPGPALSDRYPRVGKPCSGECFGLSNILSRLAIPRRSSTLTKYPLVISDLDEALALRAAGSGSWLAFADPRYESINAMFGGWTAAIALHAVLLSAQGTAQPSALTINYI